MARAHVRVPRSLDFGASFARAHGPRVPCARSVTTLVWRMYVVKRRLVVVPILFYTYINRTDRVPGAQTRGSGFRGPDSAKSSQIDESDKFLYVWRRRSPMSSASERALLHGHDSDAQRTRMMRQRHQGVALDGSSHLAGQNDVRSSDEWSMVAGRVGAVVSRRSLPPGLSWSRTKRNRRRNGLAPHQHAWAPSAEHSEAAATQDLAADSSTSRLVSDRHRCPRSGARVAECARTLSKSDPDPVHGSYRDP